MYWKIGAYLLCVIALVAGVNAIPPLPYEFYGNATVNNSPVETGTVIIAKINGTEVGNITTTSPGSYGGSGTFDRRLVVNGDEKQIGEYITFWIGENQSVQKVKLYAGESQHLDLTFVPGKEGSVDASVTPLPTGTGTGPELPSEENTTPVPTQAPLLIAPLAAGLAVLLLGRRN
ncbi:MAG: hypothetical protein LUQ07_05640 [Methanospirillum sp.]|nr:hypothetical protein [Methanospirillum sp.]